MFDEPDKTNIEELRRQLETLISGRDALIATVRQEGDSESRARRRLPASLRHALDDRNDEIAELRSQLAGNPPQPPFAR